MAAGTHHQSASWKGRPGPSRRCSIAKNGVQESSCESLPIGTVLNIKVPMK